MKIYLAGTSVCNPISHLGIQDLFKKGNKLHSYFHAIETSFEKRWFQVNMKNEVNLFLDSGAFSALTQGVEIDIQKYIEFIKKHEDLFVVYANLDVLPPVGSTKKEILRTAKQTLENQRTMEKAGLSPLPVFHVGQPWRFLEYYIKNYEYIGLGAMVGKSKKTLVTWLDHCFRHYICDEKGMPKIKVHGFGLTALDLMLRYPWYSVDSTSWVIAGRLGSIYVPRYGNGKWRYEENSWKIAVSNKSPSKKEDGRHFTTLSPKQQEIVLQYITEKGRTMGVSEFVKKPQDYVLSENERWAERKPESKTQDRLVEIIKEPGVSNMYQIRDEMNIEYFLDLEREMPAWPRPFQSKSVPRFVL